MGDFLHKAYDRVMEENSIDIKDLDDMITDLESEDIITQDNDMQQAYLDKLDEILAAIKSAVHKQKKHIMDDNKLVKDLTVGELKSLMKEFTNEIINVINKKQRIEYIPTPQTPQPAWYGPVNPLNPWEPNKVWCSDRTVTDKEIMELHKKLNGEING